MHVGSGEYSLVISSAQEFPFHAHFLSRRCKCPRNQKKMMRLRPLRHIYSKPSRVSLLREQIPVGEWSFSSRRAPSKLSTVITRRPSIDMLLWAKHRFVKRVVYTLGVVAIKSSRTGLGSCVLSRETFSLIVLSCTDLYQYLSYGYMAYLLSFHI